LLTAYKKKVTAIHEELGIPESYEKQYGLSLQEECSSLSSAGVDIFNRETLMQTETLRAWIEMQDAAAQQGIELQLVSAFRSVEYQKKLFLKKLDSGLSINEILKVNAAPGYSEHHSGRALDLTCPGAECLEESFENSQAFEWLSRHAADHAFTLSFPRNNPQGFLYEPWHWCHHLNNS
tara:strand:+ start:127009 stop:127545 length:537 start_codon:yes stop_codon:yes gene_type:complete